MSLFDYGVAFWKNDECKGYVATSKKELLMAYDLITLVGLEECESHFLAKGWQIEQTVVEISETGNLYLPIFKEAISYEAVQYSCL